MLPSSADPLLPVPKLLPQRGDPPHQAPPTLPLPPPQLLSPNSSTFVPSKVVYLVNVMAVERHPRVPNSLAAAFTSLLRSLHGSAPPAALGLLESLSCWGPLHTHPSPRTSVCVWGGGALYMGSVQAVTSSDPATQLWVISAWETHVHRPLVAAAGAHRQACPRPLLMHSQCLSLASGESLSRDWHLPPPWPERQDSLVAT